MFQIHPDLTHANACKCFIEGATPLQLQSTSKIWQILPNKNKKHRKKPCCSTSNAVMLRWRRATLGKLLSRSQQNKQWIKRNDQYEMHKKTPISEVWPETNSKTSLKIMLIPNFIFQRNWSSGALYRSRRFREVYSKVRTKKWKRTNTFLTWAMMCRSRKGYFYPMEVETNMSTTIHLGKTPLYSASVYGDIYMNTWVVYVGA